MLVISDNMTTEEIKYVVNILFVLSQFLYTQEAVTSLAISKTTPIANTAVAAPGKIVMSPTIEKYPETTDTLSAEKRSNKTKSISFP
jgi:hypothetical protein